MAKVHNLKAGFRSSKPFSWNLNICYRSISISLVKKSAVIFTSVKALILPVWLQAWDTAAVVIFWNLWLARNRKVFDNVRFTIPCSLPLYLAIQDIELWLWLCASIADVAISSSVVVQVLTMSTWSFSACGCSRLGKRSNCRALCYDEQDMINNLGDDDAMSNIVDGGTWRSVLYRVSLQDTSTWVAVKKLQNKSGPVDASLDNRRHLLGRIGHDNIISLADWIRRDDFILIVYDHKENGSLHQWLHHDPAERVLDWPTRRAIAVAVAGGLCYLHHGCKSPIVHHNINSTNILLDTGLKPKIAGFDFAQVNLAGPDQPVPIWELSTGNMFGYTAPEYATMVTTSKVDVYSLGVLLLELVTGRVASAAVADGHLATWAGKHCNQLMENTGDFRDVVDMAIPDRVRYLKEMAAMFRLGVDCTTGKPHERPAMHKVHCRLRNRGR